MIRQVNAIIEAIRQHPIVSVNNLVFLVLVPAENKINPAGLVVHIPKRGERHFIPISQFGWEYKANVLHEGTIASHDSVRLVIRRTIEVAGEENSRWFVINGQIFDTSKCHVGTLLSRDGTGIVEMSIQDRNCIPRLNMHESANCHDSDRVSIPPLGGDIGSLAQPDGLPFLKRPDRRPI